ncbi:AraC family transcriptional regulator, partial [Pseudorhizobium marinum]|uniref:AraC family transcriptional regulator n=1 Tax=Pseudorhizobium marinum TaxID=1496690 RepID=UPI0004983597
MDPLSHLLALLQPRSYITAGFDAGGSWSLVLDDLAGRIKCYAVMKGECWLSIDDMEPVWLQAGDCFVLPTGRRAAIAGDLDAKSRLASQTLEPSRSGQVITYNGGGDVFLVGSRFEVEGRHAEVMLQTLPPLIRVEASADQAKLRLYIELMMDELREGRPGAGQVAQNLSHMMLAQTLRLYIERLPQGEVGWLAALADPRLAAGLTAMHAAPAHPWTVQELARISGMSRTSFAQHFRMRVGLSPISYLTQLRMMSAAAHLIRGVETISDISVSLGYASDQAFSTAFKRTTGRSPRQYAKESQLRELWPVTLVGGERDGAAGASRSERAASV